MNVFEKHIETARGTHAAGEGPQSSNYDNGRTPLALLRTNSANCTDRPRKNTTIDLILLKDTDYIFFLGLRCLAFVPHVARASSKAKPLRSHPELVLAHESTAINMAADDSQKRTLSRSDSFSLLGEGNRFIGPG